MSSTPTLKERIDWTPAPSRQTACPVCGLEGDKSYVLSALESWHNSVNLALHACPGCGSKFFPDLTDAAYDTSDNIDAPLKFYLEVGAGIDILTRPLFMTPLQPGNRYLDVGCGFGFAVDFAKHAMDLTVQGVDPSSFGAAGARQLGLPISSSYLTEKTDLASGPFDLIVGSEVIEHVFDPLAFINILKRQLAPDGLLYIATPHADAITQENSLGNLLPLLCPGWHYILFSEEGLTHILREAGFKRIITRRSDNTVIAIATNSERAIEPAATVDPALFMSYLEKRSHQAVADSPLQVGLTYRLFKHLTNTGQYQAALPVYEEIRSAFQRLYDFDLDSTDHSWFMPIDGEDFTPLAMRYPMCLTGVCYFRGIIALNHEQNPSRAAPFFELSSRYAACLRQSLQNSGADDGETEVLGNDAAWLHLRATAYSQPVLAAEAALQLAEKDPQHNAKTERIRALRQHLINLGATEPAERLAAKSSS